MKNKIKMQRIISLLFFYLSILVCFSQASLTKLNSIKEFDKFKSNPLSSQFSNVETVKVIYDLKSKKVYYINGNKYSLHFTFCVGELGYPSDLYLFNTRNYNSNTANRDYFLGNLSRIKGSNNWFLEISSSDKMKYNDIEKFFSIVTKSSFIKDSLKFYLNSFDLIQMNKTDSFHFRCIYSNEIFDKIEYQNIVKGYTVGVLKKYTNDMLKTNPPSSKDIILLDETPDFLPNVKGIIVSELQTPLSHLVILGKNRKIPILAFKNAWNDLKLKNLEGKVIDFHVTEDSFLFHASKNTEVYNSSINTLIHLKKDTSIKKIVAFTTIPKNGVNYIGSKAYNFACLKSISKNTLFSVPEYAFAIPFYFYEKHLQENNISILIDELLSIPTDSITRINQQLKIIRKKIKNANIDTALIRMVIQNITSQNSFSHFKFRSSTNAEDLDGFNGAGLYDSKSAIIGDSVKTIEKAILQVWASAWNDNAFWERQYFNVDQKTISMGILVQRSFTDEEVNGVAITKNLYRKDFPGFTINTQKGEAQVVNPKKGETSEQFILYNSSVVSVYGTNITADYITLSNLNENKPLLTKAELKKLYVALESIQFNMNKLWKSGWNTKICDVEFKFENKTRKLYIKQVRVFND
jgi:hypothetical protein